MIYSYVRIFYMYVGTWCVQEFEKRYSRSVCLGWDNTEIRSSNSKMFIIIMNARTKQSWNMCSYMKMFKWEPVPATFKQKFKNKKSSHENKSKTTLKCKFKQENNLYIKATANQILEYALKQADVQMSTRENLNIAWPFLSCFRKIPWTY